MSTHCTTTIPWWESLGLTIDTFGDAAASPRARALREAKRRVLADHAPIGFARIQADGAVGLDDVRRRLREVEAEHFAAESEAEAARRAEGWAKLAAAYERRDANAVIAGGRWSGFTMGDAIAWCWNLLQFEPRGFVFPGMLVRAEAIKTLERGDLPIAFGYPERARALADAGFTPTRYRQHQEGIGKPTFSAEDVRQG